MDVTITRTINGVPVNDDEMANYVIRDKHVIGILYRAQNRIIENSKKNSPE